MPREKVEGADEGGCGRRLIFFFSFCLFRIFSIKNLERICLSVLV